jgi:hypothetical protein
MLFKNVLFENFPDFVEVESTPLHTEAFLVHAKEDPDLAALEILVKGYLGSLECESIKTSSSTFSVNGMGKDSESRLISVCISLNPNDIKEMNIVVSSM